MTSVGRRELKFLAAGCALLMVWAGSEVSNVDAARSQSPEPTVFEFGQPVDEGLEPARILLAQAKTLPTPTPDTIDFLRFNWAPDIYLFEWLKYMDFTNVSFDSAEGLNAQVAIGEIDSFAKSSKTTNMKAAFENYLLTNPPDELASGVLYYYFNRVVDVKGAIHDPAEFSSLMPVWSLLAGPNTKFMQSYVHIDLAWQAVAEGNGALALQYYQLVRDTAWQLIQEHPADPIQIWNVYNYMISSVPLGETSVASGIEDLRALIAAHPSTVLSWTARHQIAAFSVIYPNIQNESQDQISKMVPDLDGAYLQDALDRPDVMRDAKAMIEMMKANVLRADTQFDTALTQYDYVLSEYAGCMEWVPRTEGRNVVNSSQYGVVNMTAFSRAEVRGIIYRKEPQLLIDAYEEFVAAHPKSEYTDHARWKLGRHKEYVGDIEGAKLEYEAILTEHPYSSLISMTVDRLTEVDAELLSIE